MCGIIGCIGGPSSVDIDLVISGLKGLEYRGYDSTGVCLLQDELIIEKQPGKVADLVDDLKEYGTERFQIGIGHTRWSTHGPPTNENAHPHTDCTDQIAVVQNGIISNYESIKSSLVESGHEFKGETDAEVVPHLVEEYITEGFEPLMALRRTSQKLEGSFALVVAIKGYEKIYAARNNSPLVVGLGEDLNFIASDVPAFIAHTDNAIYLENGDVAEISQDEIEIRDSTGDMVDREIKEIVWQVEDAGKAGFEHFTLKEIHEQPRSIRQCIRDRIDEVQNSINIGLNTSKLNFDSVHLVGAGGSYPAGLYGAYLFREAGVPSYAFSTSEYLSLKTPENDPLIILISQSGETAETVKVARNAPERADTIAVTNRVGSTLTRDCDHTVYIRAGAEIGVSATKTFTSQAVLLNLLVKALLSKVTAEDDLHSYFDNLRNLDSYIQQDISSSRADEIAAAFHDSSRFFIIGSGLSYPVALEGSLKLREIAYKDAYAHQPGELKYGPLALVTNETPVIAVLTGDSDQRQKTLGSIKEVRARGAPVISITDNSINDIERLSDEVMKVQKTHIEFAPLVVNVQLQLFSYYVANKLGRSIDKPRNLAKSVTVE